MLYEPTTLASVARLIGDCLESDYGIDAEPLFAELDIDRSKFVKPGSRVSFAKMNELWSKATAVTNDPWFGFAVGEMARPSDFFVLGHAWLASATLKGALRRLCRYGHVLTTQGSTLKLLEQGDTCVLIESYADAVEPRQKAAKDAGFVALLRLSDFVTHEPVRPISVSLTIDPEFASTRYSELFQCAVTYGAEEETWVYDARELDQRLAGNIPDVAEATDRIAEEYIRSLDSGTVATAVRSMIMQTLPSGRTSQDTVAQRLHRSRSTLQRQLSAEGTSYRDILESTRRTLAERYLADGEYSQVQVAFMTGFADQSNFARAFKRWTGVSPGEFQKSA